MSKIILLKSPGHALVERRIIKMIYDNLIFYLHKEDDCLYFIVSDILYGYKQLKITSVNLSPTINVFWRDTANFKIENNILKKDPSSDFKIIDSYIELKELYDLIRLC